jgi:hypothetical protein
MKLEYSIRGRAPNPAVLVTAAIVDAVALLWQWFMVHLISKWTGTAVLEGHEHADFYRRMMFHVPATTVVVGSIVITLALIMKNRGKPLPPDGERWDKHSDIRTVLFVWGIAFLALLLLIWREERAFP